ncbi:MAG: hypothetical protein K2X27_22820 [Candidatus Obscuribacterales bacterium]|nr:hypothetical protein [Candidatus Obscuribacterales bacterium]
MSNLETISFSFCQVSDLNLDSNVSLSLHLSPTQRAERRSEALKALAECLKLARELAVDAVFLPGNLFDADQSSSKSISELQAIFADLQKIPIFVCAGARDPLFNDSFYDELALQAHGLNPWPKNVHIFPETRSKTFTIKSKSRTRISGFSLSKNNLQKPFAMPKNLDSDGIAFDILLQALPPHLIESENLQNTIEQELKTHSYSYCAFSGSANKLYFHSENNGLKAAASGSFSGQSEIESGPRVALFGKLSKQLSGEIELKIQEKEFDPRRIYSLNFELRSEAHARAQEELEKSIKECGARKEIDILVLHLSGSYPKEKERFQYKEELESEYFHLKLMDNSRPDYLESLSKQSVIEQAFVEKMNLLKISLPSDASAEERELIDDALYLGLEAISKGKVSVGDAD